MRLCYIASLSIHTQRWVRYFAERGHEVHLILFHAAQSASGTIPPGVQIYDLTSQARIGKVRFLIWALRVRAIVRDLRPDLLHAHQVAGAGWLGAAAGYHPLVVTAWGSDLLVNVRRSWAQRQLARWVLRHADYVTCVSHSLASAARGLGAEPGRLEVVPWGVDTTVFFPPAGRTAEQARARFALGSGPVVLSPRSMKALYNPLDIARAIPDVLRQAPNACFVVRTHICDPNLLAQFRSLVDQSGVTESVRYVGDLPDEQAIADLYRAADVVVSVPSSDGTPSSVLEALACGAVPVLSDVVSLHEWVRDAQEGLFVPVGDVPAISRAIVSLLTDEALRLKLRDHGVRLIRERADSRVWMRRSEEIYRECCTSSI